MVQQTQIQNENLPSEIQSEKPPDLGSFYNDRVLPLLRYMRRNPILLFGLAILFGLLAFVVLGYIFYDVSLTEPLSVPARERPSLEYPLGTDTQGRDILALMIVGTPLTLRVGLIAGAVGVVIGMVLGFSSAYIGGTFDSVVRILVDSFLTIPGLLVLVLIAVSLPDTAGGITVDQLAFVLAALAWLFPTRTIRSQVLVMRESGYVKVAKMSGTSAFGIIFKEMVPNLTPFIFASFVNAVASAMLASIGIESLGLGPLSSPTLGTTIYLNIFNASLLQGTWWWFGPPIAVIVLLFTGLFMVLAGLDEISNPRLRRRI